MEGGGREKEREKEKEGEKEEGEVEEEVEKRKKNARSISMPAKEGEKLSLSLISLLRPLLRLSHLEPDGGAALLHGLHGVLDLLFGMVQRETKRERERNEKRSSIEFDRPRG